MPSIQTKQFTITLPTIAFKKERKVSSSYSIWDRAVKFITELEVFSKSNPEEAKRKIVAIQNGSRMDSLNKKSSSSHRPSYGPPVVSVRAPVQPVSVKSFNNPATPVIDRTEARSSYTPSTELIVWQREEPTYVSRSSSFSSEVTPPPSRRNSFSSVDSTVSRSRSSSESIGCSPRFSEKPAPVMTELDYLCKALVENLRDSHSTLKVVLPKDKSTFEELKPTIQTLLVQAGIQYEADHLQPPNAYCGAAPRVDDLYSARGILKRIVDVAVDKLTQDDLIEFVRTRPVDRVKENTAELQAVFSADLKLARELAEKMVEKHCKHDDIVTVINAVFEHYTEDQQLRLHSLIQSRALETRVNSVERTPSKNLHHKLRFVELGGDDSYKGAYRREIYEAIPERVKSGQVEDRERSLTFGSVSRSLFSEAEEAPKIVDSSGKVELIAHLDEVTEVLGEVTERLQAERLLRISTQKELKIEKRNCAGILDELTRLKFEIDNLPRLMKQSGSSD